MAPQNSNSYLETQVLTSSQQKLQLILIEAAIRFAKKAQKHRELGEEAAACEMIGRSQKIVSEIIGGLNPEVDPELVGQIASIYVFISRSLSQANLPENGEQLADAIRILEEERTTWQLVCKQFSTENAGQNEAAMLHQQASEKEIVDVDFVKINSTAGDATVPEGNLLSMPSATYDNYAPLPQLSSEAPSIPGLSGPNKLSGPKKASSENAAAPTAGFSIDA